MVEDVESLEAELKRLGLVERHALQQGHIVIVESRTVKEAALGVPGLSQGLETEEGSIEIRFSIARIGIQMQRSRGVLRLIHTKVVDAIGLGSQQRVVAVVEQRHRKTAAEMSDTGNRPAFCATVGSLEQTVEGKFVGVADHEVVLHVECRQSTAQPRIDRINCFADVGGLIDRFAVGVAGEQLQALAGMAKAELER